MATPTFFHAALEVDDSRVCLSRNESLHALKSRRLKVGSLIKLINGRGLIADAVIDSAARAELEVVITQTTVSPAPRARLTIACAIPKGDRQKTMIDMATQLGVHQIIPLESDFSITKFSANMAEKWRRTALEACKQSQNPWLPSIADASSIADCLEQLEGSALVCDAGGSSMQDRVKASGQTTVFIGPEGGFSEAEAELFARHSVSRISLARTILRTETAVLAAVSQWGSIASRDVST